MMEPTFEPFVVAEREPARFAIELPPAWHRALGRTLFLWAFPLANLAAAGIVLAVGLTSRRDQVIALGAPVHLALACMPAALFFRGRNTVRVAASPDGLVVTRQRYFGGTRDERWTAAEVASVRVAPYSAWKARGAVVEAVLRAGGRAVRLVYVLRHAQDDLEVDAGGLAREIAARLGVEATGT